MEITINEKPFSLNLTTFTSVTGETFKLDESLIQEQLQKCITNMEIELKNKCKTTDIVADFDSTENKTDSQIASNTFFKKFFIKYFGNPSMNGGVFMYGDYNVEVNTQHLYHDSGMEGQGYQSYIAKGLACCYPYREWGYGPNQLAYKHIKEDKETAKEFIDFMFTKSGMYLCDDNPYVSKREKANIGEGLFWYCVRSMYFDRLDELIDYVGNLEHLPQQLKELYDNISRNLSKDSVKRSGFKDWFIHELTKIDGLQNIFNIDESNIFTDAAHVFEKVYDSYANKQFKFLVKNEDNYSYSLDMTALDRLEPLEYSVIRESISKTEKIRDFDIDVIKKHLDSLKKSSEEDFKNELWFYIDNACFNKEKSFGKMLYDNYSDTLEDMSDENFKAVKKKLKKKKSSKYETPPLKG